MNGDAQEPQGVWWREMPPADAEDMIGIWAQAIVAQVLASAAEPVSADVQIRVRDELEGLARRPHDNAFPLRYLCLPPNPTGFVMYEFTALEPDLNESDWKTCHQQVLHAMSAGAIRASCETSEVPGVEAAISMTLYELESQSGSDSANGPFVVGQIAAIARRQLANGQIDILARAVSAELDLLELSSLPLMSFLHGDEVLAASAG